MEKRISIYVGEDARKYIEQHKTGGVSVSGIISDAIDRLTYLLHGAKPYLDVAEWNLIFDSLNGVASSPVQLAVNSLAGVIEDSITLASLDKKWDVDGSALVSKLNALDRSGKLAVIDRAELHFSSASE